MSIVTKFRYVNYRKEKGELNYGTRVTDLGTDSGLDQCRTAGQFFFAPVQH